MKGYVVNTKPGAMEDKFHFLMNSSLYDALWFAYCLEVGILHEMLNGLLVYSWNNTFVHNVYLKGGHVLISTLPIRYEV